MRLDLRSVELLLCLGAVWVCVCVAQRAEYRIASSLVLDKVVTFADVKFYNDEDFYVTEGIPCLRKCKARPACAPCDFSRKGKECGTNSECGCKDLVKYCNELRESEWDPIKENQRIGPRLLALEKPHFYRFYISGQKCAAFYLNVEMYGGNMEMAYSLDNPFPDSTERVAFRWRSFYHSPAVICPSTVFIGTVFIGIFSIAELSNYSFWIEPKDMEDDPSIRLETNQTCTPTELASDCIDPGVPKTFNSTQLLLKPFSYVTSRCEELHAYMHINNWIPNGTLRSSTYGVQVTRLGFGKTFYFISGFIKVCPPPGENATLIFNVYAGSLANITLVVESRPDLWKRTKIAEAVKNAPVYYSNILNGAVTLSCPSALRKNVTCYAAAVIPPDCYVFSQYYGFPLSKVPYQLKLIPPFDSILENPDDLFFDDEEALNSSVLSSIILLQFQDIFPMFANNTVEEWHKQLQNCTLSMDEVYSLISLENGDRVKGSFPLQVAQEEECTSSKFSQLNEQMSALIQQLTEAPNVPQAIEYRYLVDALTTTSLWQSCNKRVQQLLISRNTSSSFLTQQCLLSPVHLFHFIGLSVLQ